MDKPLLPFGLPPAAVSALKAAGITRQAQFTSMSDIELLSVRGIGPVLLQRIRVAQDRQNQAALKLEELRQK